MSIQKNVCIFVRLLTVLHISVRLRTCDIEHCETVFGHANRCYQSKYALFNMESIKNSTHKFERARLDLHIFKSSIRNCFIWIHFDFRFKNKCSVPEQMPPIWQMFTLKTYILSEHELRWWNGLNTSVES